MNQPLRLSIFKKMSRILTVNEQDHIINFKIVTDIDLIKHLKAINRCVQEVCFQLIISVNIFRRIRRKFFWLFHPKPEYLK